MKDLKPCPFCGSNNVKYIELYLNDKTVPLIKCLNCDTYGPRWNEAKEKAIMRWNNRSSDGERLQYNLIDVYLRGYKKGMHDTEELLKPFVKEGVLND